MSNNGPFRRSFADYQDVLFGAGFFRSAAIAILGVGFTAGPVALVLAFGGPRLTYLLPMAFFISLLAVGTTAILTRPDRRVYRGAAVRMGEFVVVLLITRVVVWALRGGFPTWEVIRSWLRAPGGFFDIEFVLAALILGATWVFSLLTAADFAAMRIQPDEVAARERRGWADSASQWRVFLPIERSDILGRFSARWLGGGMFLIVCAAASRVSLYQDEQLLTKFALRDASLPVGVLAGMIVYFITGVLLMSHGRLAVLRGRWHNEGVKIERTLVRRWHTVSIVTVLLLGLLALLLPLGPTGWLADAITWLMALVWRIGMGLFSLFQALMALLLYALQRGRQTGDPPPVKPPSVPQVIPTQTEALMQIPDWLGGAVLWGAVVVICGYALLRFFSTGAFHTTQFGRRWLRLRIWWRARQTRAMRILRLQATSAAARLRRVWRRPSIPGQAAPVATPELPRDKVRAYYLNALLRAADSGVVRPPHQTPAEFAEALDAAWPDVEQDVDALTTAFNTARYARVEINTDHVDVVRQTWRRLLQALRHRPPTG